MRAVAVAVLAVLLAASAADQKSWDCKMRQLGLDFAQTLQPFRSLAQFQEVADALNGSPEAQGCSVAPTAALLKPTPRPVTPLAPNSIFVDAVQGSDSNPGTITAPLKTIGKAVTLSETSGSKSIVLRAGTFYLPETIQLGPQDSSLSFTAYNGEEVWISGGILLSTQWKPYNVSSAPGGANVYVADLTGQGVSSILGLRQNGVRSIRARYPNANPELQGFGSTLHAKSWVAPTTPTNPDIEINPATPFRNTSESFQHYQLGIGGPCEHFTPPAGYWCGNGTSGGGAFTYRVPSGFVADKTVFPNSPYANPVGAVLQVWRPSHWASWMFEIGSFNASTSTYTFSKGGFQGARGNNDGEDMYIENVFEELDSPDEWFYNEATSQLFLWYNGTGAPDAKNQYVATNLKVLVNITGTQATPVKDVTFSNLGFRDSAYTYLDPHGMPSGGDWGFQRTGSIFIEGTENVLIQDSWFDRIDGNAILVSAYNRNTTILRNEFSWIGDTAIGQWGNAEGVPQVPGMGWDGTNGDQPRGTQILYNFVHELGIWEKQSSFYFQAKSAQNLLMGNIFFNGPRAGINFNDGFGGGSNITYNVLFNTCRESGDHGPFNSWDRQVYVTDVLNGTPSVIKQWDDISHNFIIANYNSQEGIDNDDGSCYYHTHHNVMSYSGNGMKNDFGGHDNVHHNNLYAYVGKGFGICSQLPGHEDYFYNNTVVMTADGNYGGGACSGDAITVVHDNSIYTPHGNVTECGYPLAEWQAKGNDPGTTAAPYPSDDVLLSLSKELLGL